MSCVLLKNLWSSWWRVFILWSRLLHSMVSYVVNTVSHNSLFIIPTDPRQISLSLPIFSPIPVVLSNNYPCNAISMYTT